MSSVVMQTEMIDGVNYRPRPKVSCIITTYNRADLLKRAIRSVVGQQFEDWELIVVDDASTDNTIDSLMEMMLECEGRMSYYHMPENSNRCLGKPRNEGIKKAYGQYICFLDDDNEMKPNFMKEMSRTLDQHPDVEMVYCDSTVYHGEKDNGVERSQDFVKGALRNANYIDLGEAMLRREVFDKVGLFDDDLPGCGEDWLYWNRVERAGIKIWHYPQALCKYYRHPGQNTNHERHHEVLGMVRERIAQLYSGEEV